MEKNPLYSPNVNNRYWNGLDDKELWQEFLKGDKEAFAFIYKKYIDDLFGYGMKVRYNSSLVKDCIHDLFVDLWNHKTSLSITDNIKFYLYRSLRRKIRYVVDREKSMFNSEPAYDHKQTEVSLPFEHSMILLQGEEEKRRRIIRLLSKLSPKQQEVLRLIFFDELSYEEVSEIMSINVKSVYTLAWKALSALRKNLSELLLSALILLSNF